MEQANDFLEESRQIYELLLDKPEEDFKKPTLFKGWTVNDVIGHLHIFNFAAECSLKSAEDFENFFTPIAIELKRGRSLVETQRPWLNNLSGKELLRGWWDGSRRLADVFRATDPKRRLKWAGPEMSARSSVTARQMETWAHGQELFDLFLVKRVEYDRIKNIAHLGVSTFGWTFMNRNWAVPIEVPDVILTAPSGKIWEWKGENSKGNLVKGDAKEFSQVVTQTRNVLDTELKIIGKVAKNWMKYAQCFAGPAEDPPAKGTRFGL